MNNPLEILRVLDRHLSKPAELSLFGRSALALGYPHPGAAFKRARVPDVPEIRELFVAAQPEVLALVNQATE
jgi:hypothetical protein